MAAETETAPNPTPTPNPSPAPERAELPDSATVEEIMQGGWMAGLGEDDEAPPVNPNARPRKEGDEIDPPDPDAPQQTAADGDPDAPEPEPNDPDAPDSEPETPEPDAVVADAPEFWSDDDKKVLAALPKDAQAAVAATVRKYEQQRIAFVNEKTREAAEGVKEARAVATKLYEAVNEQAAWWQQVGPKLNEAYVDKWTNKLKEAGVQSWEELADRDPGLWAKYKQQHDNEAATLAEANRRGQEAVRVAQAQQAKEANERIQAAKQEAHATMLKKYPTVFADPAIYNEKLGPYLVSKGIPVERVNQISEAAILEIAYHGMLWEQAEAAKAKAQKTAAAVLDGGKKPAGAQPQPNPAPATPTRVTPGPATRPGNRQSEAHRQVSARFRQTGDVKDAAALIQLNGL